MIDQIVTLMSLVLPLVATYFARRASKASTQATSVSWLQFAAHAGASARTLVKHGLLDQKQAEGWALNLVRLACENVPGTSPAAVETVLLAVTPTIRQELGRGVGTSP